MTHGTLGIRPGIGGTGRVGGTHMLAGHAIGIGGIAVLSIITITAARSVTDAKCVEVITSYAAV